MMKKASSLTGISLELFIRGVIVVFLVSLNSSVVFAQHSVARIWNEALLNAIKSDFARPTVHARNLFHTSIAMYDCWAAYEANTSTYFLNHNFRNFYCAFDGVPIPPDKKAAQEEAMSYAMYRTLMHRFKDSPGVTKTVANLNKVMEDLGYDPSYTSTHYQSGNPADLGNYVAEQLIEYGHRDGANELKQYQNKYYATANEPMNPLLPGNPNVKDPNRWQSLVLTTFIDQAGNPIKGTPPFLTPEWGRVIPFALKEEDRKIYFKDGNEYWVYHDPGAPPLITSSTADEFKWTFCLVSAWSSHLDPHDGVLIDISPAAQGNVTKLPETFEEVKAFYSLENGGDGGRGYELNPKTNQPYTPQFVPRGDYTRVLAEFWADGPNSETPPGHWFSILNYVSDHPLFEKRWNGKGEVLDALAWDVKSYFVLGGAVHDAAITAWGVKGYYDYTRPIFAIRYMAQQGQSSDPSLPNYNKDGMPLLPNFIELVKPGDPLAGTQGEHVNKVKIKAWRGHERIKNPLTDEAGVDWILAENWWPYQRPTFVTPPFAGYISGHSTFSRAAAEAMTLMTGDAYFPGGMSEFPVKKNEYLVFEDGPSVDFTLQWARYTDASDQCSLSRIWGGIHPPADDIPGRRIGEKIGKNAFHFAIPYFTGEVKPERISEYTADIVLYPNPVSSVRRLKVKIEPYTKSGNVKIISNLGKVCYDYTFNNNMDDVLELSLSGLAEGVYVMRFTSSHHSVLRKFIVSGYPQY